MRGRPIKDRIGEVVNKHGNTVVAKSDRRHIGAGGHTVWLANDNQLYVNRGGWSRVDPQHCVPQELAYLLPVWAARLTLCFQRTHTSFHCYGGRGITVDPSWCPGGQPTQNGDREARMGAFLRFCGDVIEHLGHRPADDWQIDRIDPEGDYVIENMEWVTAAENLRRARMTGGRAAELARTKVAA